MEPTPFESLPYREICLRQLVDAGVPEKLYTPVETTIVQDWGNATPLSAALAYLAILAYPSLGDVQQRDMLVMALRSFYTKLAIKADKVDKKRVARELSSYPNQQIEGRLSRAEKRISKRFKIARIYGFVKLQDHFNGDASMTKYFRISTGGDQSKQRMLMRDWSDTKPVLHLANALWSKLPELFPTNNPPYIFWCIEDLMFRSDEWVRSSIYLAENNRLSYALESTIEASEQVALLYPEMP